jgi:hypothetical protein
MTAHLDGIPADEVRALIRDVLRDVLPDALGRADGLSAAANGNSGAAAPPASASTPATPPSGVPAGQARAAVQPDATTQPASARHQSTAPHQVTAAPVPRAVTDPVATRQVRLETDADLRQFALDILRLADNPARRRDLLTGRLAFTLALRSQGRAQTPDHRVETGAVTERAVQSAAKAGQRIVLGPRAVLTPLARDRALALGVPIEKER